MDNDREPAGITTLRLFPLSGVVFFPHCVLPLHIFEPRYRQMTEDALDGDRLVTIVMPRPGAGWADPPALEEFGCVGRILQHERLPDGRFNFLLLGLKRVRLLREVEPDGKLYRSAEAEVLDDIEVDEDDPGEATALRSGLVEAYRHAIELAGGMDPEIAEVLESDLPLGVLADILAHSWPIPAARKQTLLAEPNVEARVVELTRWFADLRPAPRPAGGAGRDFPPTFSPN
jgi:Lon protease-like protein